jgi:hypothetical protein
VASTVISPADSVDEYEIYAGLGFSEEAALPLNVSCTLAAGATTLDTEDVTGIYFGQLIPLSLHAITAFTGPVVVTVTCQSLGVDVVQAVGQLTIVEVGG